METTLPDTAHRFRAGHRVRLQVSGGAHPRYARNLTHPRAGGSGLARVPTKHRICHGGAAPSSLTLPLA
ncbi:X-Pro dipeptidyl-peptidase C-terminal non-catalytic domain-containing protein [Blastococcus sp. DSM 46786]|nr:X-Pro dipeptidyl-peptidase C-terminal non-catalytic domain-containing protein [Blastococcus sp. DSM 46786]